MVRFPPPNHTHTQSFQLAIFSRSHDGLWQFSFSTCSFSFYEFSLLDMFVRNSIVSFNLGLTTCCSLADFSTQIELAREVFWFFLRVCCLWPSPEGGCLQLSQNNSQVSGCDIHCRLTTNERTNEFWSTCSRGRWRRNSTRTSRVVLGVISIPGAILGCAFSTMLHLQ